MTHGTGIPGFWRFTWMFWMQPVHLHRLLESLGVDPRLSLVGFWKKSTVSGAERTYVLRCAQQYLPLIPMVAVLAWLDWVGVSISIQPDEVTHALALGVAGGVAGGLAVGVALGVAVGMAVGVAIGVPLGLVLGGFDGIPRGVAFGIPVGTGVGIVGIPVGTGVGVVALSEAAGMGVSVAVGVALGAAIGTGAGVVVGMALGVASIVAALRLAAYPLEATLQVFLWRRSKRKSIPTLQWAPVLWHDLSYLPHPFLADHIVATAPVDPELTGRALQACKIAPGQRKAGEKALAILQARDLVSLAKSRRYEDAASLQSRWLPSVEGAPPLLAAFREIPRLLHSSETSLIADRKLEHLDNAAKALGALRNQTLADHSYLGREFPAVLDAWQAILDPLLAEARSTAARTVPNPFRAGDPLGPNEGQRLFLGRDRQVRQIEELIADPHSNNSVVLLGPRRCGKSSLLKMLPVLLPDAQFVFFDLQDNPANSAAGFFRALHRRAAEQAKRVAIPALPAGPAVESGAEWLRLLDEQAGGRRILLCIDEFERLEEIWGGERRELLQLMGLFRATIQHRRNVKLLVSGVAPFDELGTLWDDHFINAREVRVGHLDHASTIKLLTRPVDTFPEGTIPAEVAEAVWERTAGQPYLVQMYGSKLVLLLNREERRHAALPDVAKVEDEVLSEGGSYFRYAAKGAPQAVREALDHMAHGEAVDVSPGVRRWLERRCLITPDNRLAIPVFGVWLREQPAAV